MRIVRWARGALLTAGALGGLLCIALAVAALLGVRPLVFQSGSMSPAIEAGALAFAREAPAADLETGDIVSVIDAAGVRVTHRLVASEGTGAERALTLRGDANAQPDREPYVVTRADRVIFDVPYAGHVVSAMTHPAALLAVGALIPVLLYLGFGPSSRAGERGGRRKATGAAAVLAVAGLVAGSVTATPRTMAAFSDQGTMTSGTLGAYTVPAPVASCGLLSIGSTTVSWTAVPGATGYRVFWGSGGSQTEDVSASTTSRSLSGLITGGQFRVQALRNFGSTTWVSQSSNTLTYTNLLFLLGTCTG